MTDGSNISTAELTMDEPDDRNRLDATVQGLIHTGMDRPDGPLKVSGRATYAHEDQPTGMMTGVLVRAPLAGGQVTGLNAEAIRKLDGVRGVFHGKTFLRNPAQGTANEAPVQPDGKISYVGQPVGLVVADTFEQARHAAHMVELQITPDDAVTDLETAEIETPKEKQSSQGDLDAALSQAAYTVDATYRTGGHSSSAMEPHASIAQWDGDKLTLRGSYQMLKYNVNELADALGIDPENVHLLAPFVGGGLRLQTGDQPRGRGRGARRARARGTGGCRIDAPAGARSDNASIRDRAAHQARRGYRRAHDRHRPRFHRVATDGRKLCRAGSPGHAIPLPW